MDKISVIVPIYGVEDYLPKCLESIIHQTYGDLEIILIDDGSQDNCPSICEEYSLKDNRIIVVHKENGGLSSARNAGLDIATGEYVSFVDGDDWLEPRMLESLHNAVVKYKAEIVTCGINRITDSKVIPTCDNTGSVRQLSKKDYLELITLPEENVRFEVWNKLFLRSIIGDIRFKVGQIYEDIFFEREVSKNIKRAIQINESLYNYVENRLGATNSTFKMARLGVFGELQDLSDDLDGYGYSLAKRRVYMFAMDMAQQFYIALNFKELRDGRKEQARRMIKHSFDSFYHMETNLSIKYKLFYFSPALYFLVWRVRNILLYK